MPVDELLPAGAATTVSNLLAATGVALLFGIAPDAIRRQAASFRGVEHRLELVAEIDAVRFVNDSQGTQPDAVAAALRSFDAPLVLIAGGRDKGIDLVAARAGRRRAGGRDAAHRGERSRPCPDSSGPPAFAHVEEVGHARRRAASARTPWRGSCSPEHPAGTVATVLLSPAAASFDQFPDYAARGHAFKDGVAALAAAACSRPEEVTMEPADRSRLAARRIDAVPLRSGVRGVARDPGRAGPRAPAARPAGGRAGRPARRRDPPARTGLGDRPRDPGADRPRAPRRLLLVRDGRLPVDGTATRSPRSVHSSQWAAVGLVGMLVAMRVDYRWLRLASAPDADRRRHPARPRPGPGVPGGGRRLGSVAQAAGSAGDPAGRVREARPRRLPRPLDGSPRCRGRRLHDRPPAVRRHRGALRAPDPEIARTSARPPSSAPRRS